MSEGPNIPEVEPEIPTRSVSIYSQDSSADEFPVLKAFQQYIDAEQAKARKRIITMGIFFTILTLAVIAVFMTMLIRSGERNQQLNDRLVEFVMKERDRQAAPVVVNPPSQADNSAILQLTDKLEAMRKELNASQARADKAERAAADAAAEAAKPKGPSAEELEIKKLKEQLQAERDRSAEQERIAKEAKRKAELEEYYRKHYPDLYAPKTPAPAPVVRRPVTRKRQPQPILDDELDEDEELDEAEVLKSVNEKSAVKYFDEEDEEEPVAKPVAKPKAEPKAKAIGSYSIPVEVKGKKSSWRIPNE